MIESKWSQFRMIRVWPANLIGQARVKINARVGLRVIPYRPKGRVNLSPTTKDMRRNTPHHKGNMLSFFQKRLQPIHWPQGPTLEFSPSTIFPWLHYKIQLYIPRQLSFVRNIKNSISYIWMVVGQRHHRNAWQWWVVAHGMSLPAPPKICLEASTNIICGTDISYIWTMLMLSIT